MKIIETAPVICESCGKVFQAKYAFLCPRCLKKLRSDTAKKTGLNKIGNKSYSEQQRRKHNAEIQGTD